MPRIQIEDREHRYILLTEWAKNPRIEIVENRSAGEECQWIYPSTHKKCEGSLKKYDPIRIPFLGPFNITISPEEEPEGEGEGEGEEKEAESFQQAKEEERRIWAERRNKIIQCELLIEEVKQIGITLHDFSDNDYTNQHHNSITKSFILNYPWEKDAEMKELIRTTIENYGQSKKGLQIYYNRHSDCWSKLSVVDAVQTVEQIFFPRGVMEGIVQTIDTFLGSQERYVRYGRAYKLTFLLKGAPGMGKSTVARAIAHKLQRNLYMLNLANVKGDGDLVEIFRDIKPNSVLVIEDMDSFFVGRKPGESPVGLSFSAIINILDGSLSTGNGLITFITANHPEHLDKAILRPGRTDRIVHFGDMSREQFDAAWVELVDRERPSDEELFRICQRNQISMSGLMDIFFHAASDEERRTLARQSVADRKFAESGASMYT
jgi:ATP-dependent 26S proteasome regulatory subunit